MVKLYSLKNILTQVRKRICSEINYIIARMEYQLFNNKNGILSPNNKQKKHWITPNGSALM